MKSSHGVKRHKRRKEKSNEDKMKPIVVENHTDGREFKQLQNMNSSQGLKTKAGKNKRQRRSKTSNDTKEMKSIDVADFENHTGFKKTGSVGKKRRRKASVGVKEKMSAEEADKVIMSRLGSVWKHDHVGCCRYREFYRIPNFDWVKDWIEAKELSEEEEEEEMVEFWLPQYDEEEERQVMILDKLLAARKEKND